MTSHALRNTLFPLVASALFGSLSQAQTGSTTRIEETDKSITYSGTWYTNSSSLNSGGSAALTNAPGATAVVSFTGTGITWIGVLDPWAGMATVYLDGTMSTVDSYGATTQYQHPVFSVSGLANGPHTLSIQVTHTRDANGQGSWVWIDAFDIQNGSVLSGGVTAGVGRTEQNSPAVTYTGVWLANTTAALSGGSAVLATNAGSSATITFNGTGITWIAYRDQYSGIATVYVDGTVKATIDTYLSPAQAQTAGYAISGLAPGTHSLTIEVTGTHDASSGGSWVWVDAFDVVGGTSAPVSHTADFSQIGVFRPAAPVDAALGFFVLDSNGNNASDPADKTRQFGLAGDIPVAGDWDGTGVIRLGVFRCPPAGGGVCSWYLDQNNNGAWDGVAGGDISFQFGLPGDIPVVGDWNGTGVSKVGVMRCPAFGQPGVCTWILDAANKRSPSDPSFLVQFYGVAGDQPAVGNWSGAVVGNAPVDHIGVFRNGTWFVDSNGDGAFESSDGVYVFGLPGDVPVVGDWNSSGKKRIGIFRPATAQWILDTDGNGLYGAADQIVLFGLPGDKPLVGFWTMQ